MAELARKIERTVKHALWTIVVGSFFRKKKSPPTLPVDFTSISSVLVIRTDRLGDVILSTPVYESIKNSFPHLRVSALVNRSNVPVLTDNPNVDEIISFNPRNPGATIKQLRQNKFDVAFTLNKKFSAIASLFALLSKAKYKISYAHDETSWLYDIRLPIDKQPRHESLNNLELLAHSGLTKISKAPRLYFTD
ncbi:uncharacterized protein METZ01_LOCUS240359, partial [marine metagenome]